MAAAYVPVVLDMASSAQKNLLVESIIWTNLAVYVKARKMDLETRQKI
jgi:hypothetical protein